MRKALGVLEMLSLNLDPGCNAGEHISKNYVKLNA